MPLRGSRHLIGSFAVIVLITALGSLSQTAVNSMMYAISDSFGITPSEGQWLTTIYMLAIGITVPTVAYLSKRHSFRTLALAAMGIFLVGCALDFLAPTFWMLVVGRVLQAISAGITMPLIQAFASMRFPEGQKATAMGIAGIAMGFAPNIGPVLGGVFAESVGWRLFFVVLAAICLVLILCSVFFVPQEEKPVVAGNLDVPSLVLSTLGFGGMLLGFSNAANLPLTSPLIWAPLVMGTGFVCAFLLRQKRVEHPLINLGIFKSRKYVFTFALQCCLMTSYLGITLIVPLYVQGCLGGNAIESGLVFLPATVTALFLNPVSGYLTDKLGARPIALFGGISMTAGAIGMVFMDANTSLAYAMVFQTIRGVGMSCLIGPTMAFGLSELKSLTMDGSSFIVLVRQAAASLGTALMVMIIAISLPVCGSGSALPYQAAFGFSAVFSLVMLVIIAVGVKGSRHDA